MNRKHLETYHAKTPAEMSSRSEGRKVTNRTPSSVEGKRSYKKRMKEFRANNLHPESIAMLNPTWTPQLVSPQVDGDTRRACDLTIPEYNGSPVYVQSSSEPDLEDETYIECTDNNTLKRRAVTHGERHALITRRNQCFENTIGRSRRSVEEDVDEPTSITESANVENGKFAAFLIESGRRQHFSKRVNIHSLT